MNDPAAPAARKFKWRPAPLLPAADAHDGALIFVIAVLCFLASLTAVAALGANRAAAGWQAQLVGSATVLVRPKPGETADAAAARATETVAGVTGVIQASALEREKAEDDATAQVDGRKLRKYSARKRDKMLGVRLSQDHRAKLERLARARRMNFTQIIEEGIDLVHARTKGR